MCASPRVRMRVPGDGDGDDGEIIKGRRPADMKAQLTEDVDLR